MELLAWIDAVEWCRGLVVHRRTQRWRIDYGGELWRKISSSTVCLVMAVGVAVDSGAGARERGHGEGQGGMTDSRRRRWRGGAT